MEPLPDDIVRRIEAEMQVLIPAERIQRRVAELAEEVQGGLGGERLVAVAALSGAFMFFSDLVRLIRPTPLVDFVQLRSYGSATAPIGEVTLLRDVDHPLTDRHVLIVEDILDTGHTAHFLIDLVRRCRPAAMSFVSLLDKSARRRVAVSADHVGFEIEDRFVVGYGLDFAGHFRALPDIHVVPDWVAGLSWLGRRP